MTQRTSRRSAAHWHRLAILTLLVLAGACSGRDTGARVGMSRQSVLESSTAGLPKRQEVTADEKTDFYDWGWVRYDNQERVVEVYRKPLSDPAVSSAEVLPEGSRLEHIHRIAVAAPTIEIYKRKWFGRDELAAVDVASLRNRLSELMTTHLKRRFTAVTDLNAAAVYATTASALQSAQAQFRAAIVGDPLNALSTGESANVIGWSLAQAAQQLEVDAIVLSVMTVTVWETPAGSSMRSVGTASLALSDERVDSGALCGHYTAPPPVFYPIVPIIPPSNTPPPVMASLSAALIARDDGQILWSQVGSLQGVLKTPDDLTQFRLEQLVATALPAPPIS